MKTVNGVATAALVVIAVALVALAWGHRTEVHCPSGAAVCVVVNRWTGTMELGRVSADRLRAEQEADQARRNAEVEAEMAANPGLSELVRRLQERDGIDPGR